MLNLFICILFHNFFIYQLKLVNFKSYKNTLTLLTKFDQTLKFNLNPSYSYKIYSAINELPTNWDDLATSTIFLSQKYLEVLEKSSPENMICHFIGIFKNDLLAGIAVSQFLDLNKLESFGERDKCIKTALRNFAFKNFCSNVLLIGNNMLTGQNSFAFSDEIDKKEAIKTLKKASLSLKK